MLKKRKINSFVNICFILYILGIAIFNTVNDLFLSNDSSGYAKLSSYDTGGKIVFIALVFLFYLFMTFIQNIGLVIIFFGIKLGIKSVVKEKLTDVDFGKHKDYYRETIKGYSPAVLSYIDSFEINDDKDFVATLLNLQLKKHITIKENKIYVLNSNQDDLEENEKYILDNMENPDMVMFKYLVIKDALKSGLLEEKTNTKQKVIKKLILLVVTFFVLFGASTIFSQAIFSNSDSVITTTLIIIFIIAIFIGIIYLNFSVIYLISYVIKSQKMPYVRSNEGKKINEILEGLKNYIKDFSSLDQSGKEELFLSEDYLIYSVLFNQNQKIIQEFKNLIICRNNQQNSYN